jgi:hypothetical protein
MGGFILGFVLADGEVAPKLRRSLLTPLHRSQVASGLPISNTCTSARSLIDDSSTTARNRTEG